MTTTDRKRPVLVLGSDEAGPARELLGSASGLSVSASESEALSDVACVVVETDRPGRTVEAIESIRERDSDVPIVVAPTDGDERHAAASFRAGATDYVPSADRERLTERVRRVTEPGDEPDTGDEPDARDEPDAGDSLTAFADRLPSEAFVIDEDGTYLGANVGPDAGELETVGPDELVGTHLSEAFPAETTDRLLACIERTLDTESEQSIEYEAETTKGRRQFEARVVPLDRTADGRRAVVWLARDVTERVERERAVRTRQEELATVNRINAVVRRVIRRLVEAPTREDIEREVCEQLVESELYCASWIGDRTGDGDVAYRVGAGEATAYLEAVREIDVGCESPVERACRTGKIRVTNELVDEPMMNESLSTAVRESGITSAIAVPIGHQDTVYGALVVLARRVDAFSERERDAFSLLGETIGFAINALKNKRLLFADSVIELEIRIDGGDSFSFDLTERYDCTVTLDWAGTVSTGEMFQYVTIDGLDGETAMAEAEAHDSVETCRLIHDGEDRCTIELRFHDSGVRTLMNHGATIRDLVVSDGVSDEIIEVPRGTDVRRLLEAFKSVYDNTELVARREVDRPIRTASERRQRLLDRLTDRQLTALRLAYYGGYFEWPRESTGEEIAERMDIAPPTMHQHLRKAQRALLEEFFEEGGGTVR